MFVREIEIRNFNYMENIIENEIGIRFFVIVVYYEEELGFVDNYCIV